MLLRTILGLMLCWQISANAAQSEVQTDKMEAVQAEVAKVQKLIEKYNLDLKLKLSVPKKSKTTRLVIDPALAKNLNLKTFSSAVNCDDDGDPPPRPGHGGHHDDDENTCVPYCDARWADGSCRTWGADKCGRDIDCSPYCDARWADGTCRTWGADVCN
jgi:hypothetical protein